MQHPFDGILVAENNSRRSWLRGVFAALAGLFGTTAAGAAAPPWRRPISPEPPGPPGKRLVPRPGGKSDTMALHETGRSTRALGEEGGRRPLPRPPIRRKPEVTTLALGEEGG